MALGNKVMKMHDGPMWPLLFSQFSFVYLKLIKLKIFLEKTNNFTLIHGVPRCESISAHYFIRFLEKAIMM